MMTLGLLALVTAAMFAGIALYISIAEQPARMRLVPASALTHWKPSYGNGLIVQGALSAISGLLGLITFLFYGWYLSWLYGAIFMLINWPYTWYLIMPLNRELKAMEPAGANDETMAKLSRWGWLHLVRGLLGAAGVLFYVLAATDMLQRVPGVIAR
jgi:Domain of unknown function (DUF1772)